MEQFEICGVSTANSHILIDASGIEIGSTPASVDHKHWLKLLVEERKCALNRRDFVRIAHRVFGVNALKSTPRLRYEIIKRLRARSQRLPARCEGSVGSYQGNGDSHEVFFGGGGHFTILFPISEKSEKAESCNSCKRELDGGDL